jgi:hypothetical protein
MTSPAADPIALIALAREHEAYLAGLRPRSPSSTRIRIWPADAVGTLRDVARELADALEAALAENAELRGVQEVRRGASTIAKAECERLKTALAEIDRIRNNIVGSQSINWSRDIYPLTAALQAAGFEGEGYDAARERLLTDAETIEKLRVELSECRAQNSAMAETMAGLRSNAAIKESAV